MKINNKNGKNYDYKYSNFGENIFIQTWHLSALKAIDQISTLKLSSKFLEIGSGNGNFLSLLSKKFKNSFGIEISNEAVKLCRKKNLNVRLLDYEKDNILIDNEPFDCIVATEVFEHIYDSYLFLNIINTSLKNGGYLVFTTPEFFSIKRIYGLLMGRCPTEMENPTHVRFHTFKYIKKLLAQQGFEVIAHSRAEGNNRLINFLFNRNFNRIKKMIYNFFGSTMVIVAKKISLPKYSSINAYLPEYHNKHYKKLK